MYITLLTIHNLLRWLFLAAALYAIYRAVMGLMNKSVYNKSDNTSGTFLVALAHSQLLIGIILLFVSPVIQAAMADMGAAMKDKALRLQLIEHPLTMIMGVVLIQIGRIRTRKAYADSDKYKRSLIFFGIGLLLILSRIPWGSSPMFRF
jgi:hypothetical protein